MVGLNLSNEVSNPLNLGFFDSREVKGTPEDARVYT